MARERAGGAIRYTGGRGFRSRAGGGMDVAAGQLRPEGCQRLKEGAVVGAITPTLRSRHPDSHAVGNTGKETPWKFLQCSEANLSSGCSKASFSELP